MTGLVERAATIGEKRVRSVVDRLAGQLRGIGLTVEAEADGVIVTGRGLWRLAALRWLPWWLR